MIGRKTRESGQEQCQRGRHGLALTVLLIQTLATILVPVVHASTPLSTSRAIEGQHSNQCVSLHSESRCMLVVQSQLTQPETRIFPPATRYRRLGSSSDGRRIVPQTINPSYNGKRAPPSR